TDLASAGAARRYVRDTAQGWGLAADVVDDLESIVGELAANALEHSVSAPEHGGSDLITVTLALTTATVTVGVTDAGPRRGDRDTPAASVLAGGRTGTRAWIVDHRGTGRPLGAAAHAGLPDGLGRRRHARGAYTVEAAGFDEGCPCLEEGRVRLGAGHFSSHVPLTALRSWPVE
ncbi:ATP-binding protein, partial [Streptomyces adelaidensis]|uniref:ATP-binding protein n=1 Tax=Streptomyces adelaidensis TaxID=2796465 RepID=UPI0019051099